MTSNKETENNELSSEQAPLHTHLYELRNRLLVCIGMFFLSFCVCYYFAEDIYLFLVKPLAQIYQNEEGRRLIYTGLTEAFFTYMKVAFYAALFISFPILATQVYIFLAPGFIKKRKKYYSLSYLQHPFYLLRVEL